MVSSHISVRALDCKASAICAAQQLVSVQQLTFLAVFFSPKLRLKSYYFYARRKRTRGEKGGALLQELARLRAAQMITSLIPGQAQSCLSPKFGRIIGHKAFLGSYSYTSRSRLGWEKKERKSRTGKVWEVAMYPPKPGSHVHLPPA